MVARGVWIRIDGVDEAGPDRCAAGWLNAPAHPSGDAVLVLPAIGYEHSSSHRFTRMVAERCAADGATVLRLDYFGTGDSDGDAGEVHDLQPWQASVLSAARWLRDSGAQRLTVVGVQLGALLAALTLDELAPTAVVSIAGVFTGRRFARGLGMVGIAAPDAVGGVSVGGTYYSAGVLQALSAAAAEVPEDVPHLRIGTTDQVAAFLQRAAEDAVVDPDLVEHIGEWIHDRPTASPAKHCTSPPEPTTSTQVSYRGTVVTEEFVTVGASGLVGVLTTPADATTVDAVYVLVNSGSDPHPGPGRAWVELARHLARDGLATLRVDFRGWGESPDGPTSGPGDPGRPYDAHGVDDLADIVATLRAQGRRVAVGGLCAGAWIALDVARGSDLAGAVVLNPQMFWQPGFPSFALLADGHAYLAPEFAYNREQAATGRWDREDEQGLRPRAALWLDELGQRGRPITMIFAPGDDGLEYLQVRLRRRVQHALDAGWLTVEEVKIDHGMHQAWLRDDLFALISRHLRRTLGQPADDGAGMR